MNVLPDDVMQLVRLTLGVRSARPEDRLVEDLGAESADVLNLAAAVEDRYGLHVEDEELPSLRTVSDWIARIEQGS